MKTLLEPEDIEAIASAVMEMLRPIVADKDNHVAEDAVFNKKTLAAYLRVSESTISKMVMNRQIRISRFRPVNQARYVSGSGMILINGISTADHPWHKPFYPQNETMTGPLIAYQLIGEIIPLFPNML